MSNTLDLQGKRVGKLLVIRLAEPYEYIKDSHGRKWYCKCDCGNTCYVPTAYLSGNGNYTQYSCGCDRKIRAFMASCKIPVSNEFLSQFLSDFERFLFLHKQLTIIGGKKPELYSLEEYESDIIYFWNDPQFNAVYDFWKTQNRSKTFYDYAKPSLDHIIPKSKGGINKRENFQFLTVYENLAKRDMTQEEWESFKEETHSTSDYFIESIMKGSDANE